MAEYKRDRSGKFAGSIGSGRDQVPLPAESIPHLPEPPLTSGEAKPQPTAFMPPPPPNPPNNWNDAWKAYSTSKDPNRMPDPRPDDYEPDEHAGWVASDLDLPNGTDMTRNPDEFETSGSPGSVYATTAKSINSVRSYVEVEASDGYTGESVGLMKDRATGKTVAIRCTGCGGAGCYDCDGDGWIDLRDEADDEDDESDGLCRTEGCYEDADTGDSYDGYCGNCADRMYGEADDTMSDVEADADTLTSAGMGTDEDYGYYGDLDE